MAVSTLSELKVSERKKKNIEGTIIPSLTYETNGEEIRKPQEAVEAVILARTSLPTYLSLTKAHPY